MDGRGEEGWEEISGGNAWIDPTQGKIPEGAGKPPVNAGGEKMEVSKKPLHRTVKTMTIKE